MENKIEEILIKFEEEMPLDNKHYRYLRNKFISQAKSELHKLITDIISETYKKEYPFPPYPDSKEHIAIMFFSKRILNNINELFGKE